MAEWPLSKVNRSRRVIYISDLKNGSPSVFEHFLLIFNFILNENQSKVWPKAFKLMLSYYEIILKTSKMRSEF